MNFATVAFEQDPDTGLLYSITVNGVDYASQIDYSTIAVTEAGPGGVSSMSFLIQGLPAGTSLPDITRVGMWDYTRDLPVFSGWVQSQEPTPAFDGLDMRLSCYGIEAVLDQVINPTYAPTLSDTDDQAVPVSPSGMLQVLAASTGLRAASRAAVFPAGVTSLQEPVVRNSSVLARVPSILGQTVRQSFDAVYDAVDLAGAPPARLDVDFWGNVRSYGLGRVSHTFLGSINYPTDYVDLVVQESGGNAASVGSLRWVRDTSPGQVISAVYVQGANAAGTGWVVGDTTSGRGEGYINDTGSNSDTLKRLAANTILGRRGTGLGRGSLTLEAFTPINARAGGRVIVTNAQLGWASYGLTIGQIDKTFLQNGTQNWTVSFYDENDTPSTGRASSMQLVRLLTRNTR